MKFTRLKYVWPFRYCKKCENSVYKREVYELTGKTDRKMIRLHEERGNEIKFTVPMKIYKRVYPTEKSKTKKRIFLVRITCMECGNVVGEEISRKLHLENKTRRKRRSVRIRRYY